MLTLKFTQAHKTDWTHISQKFITWTQIICGCYLIKHCGEKILLIALIKSRILSSKTIGPDRRRIMRYRKLLSTILATIFVAGAVLGINAQVKAQQDVAGYLKERLTQQKVPVVDIKTLQKFPLQIEITLQSTSDGIKGVPEDPIYLLLVEREVILARQKGYFIDRYIRITLSAQGEQIAWADTHVKLFENLLLDISPSKVSNDVTVEEITNAMRLYKTPAYDLNITSENGMQSLMFRLSVQSIDEANSVLPDVMKSISSSIDSANNKGSHVVVYRLELRDLNGNLLLNYIRDLQIGSERWWMDENLAPTWFSVPAFVP